MTLCTYKAVHCYIHVHTIVNLYIVIHYLLVLFIICVFCSVTVILLHRGSFCHENQFLVCVNIPGNKADSDFFTLCCVMYEHSTLNPLDEAWLKNNTNTPILLFLCKGNTKKSIKTFQQIIVVCVWNSATFVFWLKLDYC